MWTNSGHKLGEKSEILINFCPKRWPWFAIRVKAEPTLCFDSKIATIKQGFWTVRPKETKLNCFIFEEIANAQPLSGTTRTREAMLHAKREFERKFGGREKADRVMIVFTDGYSQV